jgi:uncharacterized membrane protein
MEKDIKIKIVPFGEVLEERVELSKQYKLVEFRGVWKLTQKCRDNYNPISYIEYLQGRVDQPRKQNQVGGERGTSSKPSRPIKRSEEVEEIFKDMIE